MCWIPKVASSTWIAHFAKIQDGKIINGIDSKTDIFFTLQKLAETRDDLKEIWNSEENLSMVVVRHPLSRLGEQ